MRGNSEKKLVSLEEGVADLKVRRKNRISIVGDFRFTLPRERKRWMEKKGRKPMAYVGASRGWGLCRFHLLLALEEGWAHKSSIKSG